MNDQLTSLYTAWLQSMPETFRALVPSMGAQPTLPVQSPPDRASMPFPADQIGKAVNVLQDILAQLYHGYLPLLAQGEITSDSIEAMAASVTEAFSRLLAPEQGAPAAWPPIAAWPTQVIGLLPGMNQLQLGAERTFGGLGEALGLGPVRQLDQAWRDMLASSLAKQRAQLEYLALVAKAFSVGTTSLLKELRAAGKRGERVESLLAFFRLWAKSVDGPLHDAMQGAPGLEVTAKVIRASSQHREQLQKVVAIASEALHVPTRTQMNDAFREIQQLKRELRRLKRALPEATQKRLTNAKEKAS